jgi:23S rRNA (uridine2552-2'-O)-methyltransferase
MRVIDLGASPGGWTQVAAAAVGSSGTVVAVDVLDMTPVPGTTFIEGDCRDADVMESVRTALGGVRADLVMSDMAPNITGVMAADEAAQHELVEAALKVTREFLQVGGSLLLKIFQGPDTDSIIGAISREFREVRRRKPPASRTQSREFYVVAKRFVI